MIEAESQVMYLEAKERQGLPGHQKPEEGHGTGSPSVPSELNQLLPTPWCWTSRLQNRERIKLLPWYATRFVGTCEGSPRKLTQWWIRQRTEVTDLHSNASSSTYSLCGLGLAAEPLWASLPISLGKTGDITDTPWSSIEKSSSWNSSVGWHDCAPS